MVFRALRKFPKTGKQATRAATVTAEIPAEAYDHAAAFLAETLDFMNPYSEEAEDSTPDIDADYQSAPDYPAEIDAPHRPAPQYSSLHL